MKLISSKLKLKTSIFEVTEERAIDPQGFEIKRAIVRHAGSAVIMPMDARGRVLLVRQYRLPARNYLWELPAGRIDRGETALRGAKRELKEETGLTAKRWMKLCSFYVSPGFLDERMTIFVAQELTAGNQQPMEDERIETQWFSLRQLEGMIRDGAIVDAKTMLGVLYWRRFARGAKGGRQSR